MKTNWSSPKTNIFAGMNDLRKCLAAGHPARLVRARNEDCEFPIRVKDPDKDFRHYKHSIGYASSVNQIKNNSNLNEFEKHLSLNYISVFGSKEAADRYYATGEYGADNFKNMGYNHLVKVDDYIAYLKSIGDHQRVNMYERQYRAPEHADDVCYFFDFFRYEAGCPYSIKKFKRKLWVVDMLDKEAKPRIPLLVYVLAVLVYPSKFIPRKSVLQMDKYRLVTYRVGAVTNGFSVEFHIPKRFSFKN
jgi:hypothetical protein